MIQSSAYCLSEQQQNIHEERTFEPVFFLSLLCHITAYEYVSLSVDLNKQTQKIITHMIILAFFFHFSYSLLLAAWDRLVISLFTQYLHK